MEVSRFQANKHCLPYLEACCSAIGKLENQFDSRTSLCSYSGSILWGKNISQVVKFDLLNVCQDGKGRFLH